MKFVIGRVKKPVKCQSTVFLIIFLILFFQTSLNFTFSQEKEAKKNNEDKKITSLKKSLLFPGWGQLAEKRYFEGIIFATSELFCLYQIYSFNRKANYYYKKYKIATNVQDVLLYRERTEKYDKLRNKYILGAAGIWVLNLVDIYYIMKKRQKRFQKKRNIKLNIFFNNGEKKIIFNINFNF